MKKKAQEKLAAKAAPAVVAEETTSVAESVAEEPTAVTEQIAEDTTSAGTSDEASSVEPSDTPEATAE